MNDTVRSNRMNQVYSVAANRPSQNAVVRAINPPAPALAHNVPFYIAAPSSTFDRSLPDGAAIPIEQRAPEEITHLAGRRIAPEGVKVYNPAFDVTPARLIRGIIHERGIAAPGELPSE